VESPMMYKVGLSEKIKEESKINAINAAKVFLIANIFFNCIMGFILFL